MAERLMALKEEVDQVADFATDSDDMPTHDGVRLGKKVPVPISASASGLPGQWAEDGSYLYICVGVDTWKRVGLSTW